MPPSLNPQKSSMLANKILTADMSRLGARSHAIEEQQEDDEDEDEEKLYFDDAIDKYFDWPSNELFESLTYPEYFQRFKVGGQNLQALLDKRSET
ncbi:8766_t:CDS:2 [Entrophospora sp. SA101]|nr:8766_t:CDS:2 [Entrophospora sp. SA101]